MLNPMRSILRAATRDRTKPLNILTGATHERYETGLSKTGHNFYAYGHPSFKGWNTNYAKLPNNYRLLNAAKGESQLPNEVDFDIVLSQNKFGQFEILSKIASQLQLPLISLEHTLPFPGWTNADMQNLSNMRGDKNVFISNYSLGKWKWINRGDTRVIKHGLDTELFKPNFSLHFGERKDSILSVVNDWIGRDWCCNFQGWQRITKGLPVTVYGDTKGLSVPAKNTEELVSIYQQHKIFLNTSVISPVPTALLEAMSCGCACVTTATCMIPEIIKHGENGLISNNEKELREYCELLLKDTKLAKELGRKARETIVQDFNEQRFIEDWNRLFKETVE